MFTTFGSKSIISEITQEYAENIPRYFWETLGKILEIVPREFPGIDSTFLWKFPRIYQNLVDIFSGYSPEKFLGIGY